MPHVTFPDRTASARGSWWPAVLPNTLTVRAQFRPLSRDSCGLCRCRMLDGEHDGGDAVQFRNAQILSESFDKCTRLAQPIACLDLVAVSALVSAASRHNLVVQ